MSKCRSLIPVTIAALLATGCGDAKDPLHSLPYNPPPVIVISDLAVNEQVDVTLSASVTDDGSVASYSWQQVSGIPVVLHNNLDANASFKAPKVSAIEGPQNLVFSLTATDDKGAQSKTNFNVVINPVNTLPQITVGDLQAQEETEVVLNAQITDDGIVASVSWSQTAGPAVTIRNGDTNQARFLAPTVLMSEGQQTLSFDVKATDDEGGIESATVNVVINPVNSAPVATIYGPENGQSFGFVETVLDGTASADSDGEIVKYQWEQVEGETVALESTDSPALRIKTQNKAASYKFQLTVTDNEGQSAQSTISLDNKPYFLQVSADSAHHCAMVQDSNGKDVYCWGDNANGKLDVPELTNPTMLISNRSVNCVLDDGVAKCWGDSSYGQLELPTLSNVTGLSIGYNHSCAVDTNGVSCWGMDWVGETVVPQLENPSQVVAGYRYSCALDDNGVNCWGRSRDPILNVPSMTGVTELFAGFRHACATYDGGLKCWGDDSDEKLMDLSVSPQSVKAVSLGNAHTCALVASEEKEEVTCVGEGWSGFGSDISDVPQMAEPRSLTSSGSHICAIDNSGVACWGSLFDKQTTPPAFDSVTSVTSGIAHSCAIGRQGDEDTQMQCWGNDLFADYDIPNLSNTVSVSANDYITCAINDEGPHCWGNSIADIVYPPIPGPATPGKLTLPELNNVTAIEPGFQSICALSDAGVQCWGDDFWGYYGTLNVPTLTNPTMLASGDTFHCAVADEGLKCWGTYWSYDFDKLAPELTNVTSLSAEDNVGCAVADSQVHCWGSDISGMFDIPKLNNPTKVVVGGYNACAIDATGVVCWGNNTFGVNRVPTLSNPTDITVGYGYACAVNSGDLVCWGWDGFGGNPVPTLEQAASGKAQQPADNAKAQKLPAEMPSAKKALLGPVKLF